MKVPTNVLSGIERYDEYGDPCSESGNTPVFYMIADVKAALGRTKGPKNRKSVVHAVNAAETKTVCGKEVNGLTETTRVATETTCKTCLHAMRANS